LVLRPRRALDNTRFKRLRRFPDDAHGARISEKIPARRRPYPARDFAERLVDSLVHGLHVPYYTYPWASADATPLYVIAHADHYRATGDLSFLKANWDSISKAYSYTATTDTDENGLIENTAFGHGWVEGGALYPPREEIYLQGLWAEASEDMEELALALKDKKRAEEAAEAADRTSEAMEKTYWLEQRGFYAFATSLPEDEPREAEPGPNRERRQARMNELNKAHLVDEDTVMPAVALWWGVLKDERAQSEIDHLGSGVLMTDWGARIISERSELYDPLSYHNGSVWPLFTGWTSVGAYQYGRPHVGYQALMANVGLTYTNALGYVTELLSGDFNSPFGRSSHHQIWSEAMVVAPLLRGMCGIEVEDAGTTLRFEPQFPADWTEAVVRNVRAGRAQFDLRWKRTEGRTLISVARREAEKKTPSAGGSAIELIVAPSFPLDAKIRKVTVNNRPAKFELIQAGDRLFAEVIVPNASPSDELIFTYDEGTDVYFETEPLRQGARSQGLRVLRSRAGTDALELVLEGIGGRSYQLKVRSPRALAGLKDAQATADKSGTGQQLTITFDGPAGQYIRRELSIPFRVEK
jgi:hypothetical protein